MTEFKRSVDNEENIKKQLLEAKRSAYNAIEYGKVTLETLDQQNEIIQEVEDTLEANDFVIQKSFRALRGMTWSGYMANKYNDMCNVLSTGTSNDPSTTATIDKRVEVANNQTVNDKIVSEKSLIMPSVVPVRDNDLDEISSAVETLHQLGVALGEQLDSQKVTLDRIDDKTNLVTDHTLAVTLRTAQLLRKTHRPLPIFVGTFQLVEVLSERYMSVSSVDGTSIAFTVTANSSSYFHVFVKEDHLFGLLNEKTQRYVGCTMWGSVAVAGERFGTQEECYLDLGPYATGAPSALKKDAYNNANVSTVITGLMFIPRHWGAGGWLKHSEAFSAGSNHSGSLDDVNGEWITSDTTTSITDKGSNNSQIVLKAKRNDEVQFGDVILPEWALLSLNLSHGSDFEFYILEESASNAAFIGLSLIGCRNTCQWDEETVNMLQINQINLWTAMWPHSIDIDVLTKMTQLLLYGVYLTEGCTIALKIMDYIMLFEVNINESQTGEQPLPPPGPRLYFVTLSTEVCISRAQTSSKDIHSPVLDGEMEHDYQKDSIVSSATVDFVLLHARLLFSRCVNAVNSLVIPSPALVHSIIVSGPEGSGKTHLLKTIAKMLRESVNNILVVVNVSCLTVNKTVLSKSLKQVKLLEIGQSPLVAYMTVLMNALNVTPTVCESAINTLHTENGRLLLLLDDLDCVLDKYRSRTDDDDNTENATSNAAIEPTDELLVLGYLISQVLQLLNSSSSDRESTSSDAIVMVLGACRMDIKHLPLKHTGCPVFDISVVVPRLSLSERRDILTVLLSSQCDRQAGTSLAKLITEEDDTVTLNGNVAEWAVRIAAMTAGYLPGDLNYLVQHMMLIHRGKAGSAVRITSEETSEAIVWDTALQATLALPPKQLQNLGVESSSASGGETRQRHRLSWQDFAGYPHVAKAVKRLFSSGKVEEGRNRTSQLTLRSLQACPKGIVLYGPTGCGKSLLARVIAAESNMNFVSIRSTEILSQYYGQTEAAIRRLFSQARAASPCVLFFDEFDSIAYKRGGDDDSSGGVHNRILSTFLNELDGVVGRDAGGFESAVLVLAACSDVGVLDEALVRPGRLQHHILLDTPNLHDVEEIIRCQLEFMPCDLSGAQEQCDDGTGTESFINVPHIAMLLKSTNPSCADVVALCQKALFAAIREEILLMQSDNVVNSDKSRKHRVSSHHFKAALLDVTGVTYDELDKMAKQRATPFNWVPSVFSTSAVITE